MLDPPLPDKSAYLVLFDRKRGTHTLLNPSTDELSDVSSVAVSDDGRSVFFGSMSYGYLGVPTEVGPDVYYWRRGSGLTMVSVGDDVTYRWADGLDRHHRRRPAGAVRVRQRARAGGQRARSHRHGRVRRADRRLRRGYLAPGMSGSRTRTRSSCMPWSTPQRTARERLSTLILR